MSMTETAGSKRALAKHLLLGQDGNPLSDDQDETHAYGYRYEHLKTGGTVELDWNDLPEPARRMFGLFGIRTLATNEASQVKQRSGGNVDPAPAIQERFNLITNPTDPRWVDRTRDGFQVNLDALAAAFVEEFAANGKTYDLVKVREKMEDDKEFVKKARSNTGINARYIERVGRPQASLDDLAAGLD